MKKSLANGIWKLENIVFYLLILLLPTQLGLHFWPDFASVLGIRIDYLSPTLYVTDILIFLLFIIWTFRKLKPQPAKNSKFKIQNSKLQFKIKKYPLILLFAFLYLIFNILQSGRVAGGLYTLLKVIEMVFVAYYTAKFVDLKKHPRKIILLLGIGASFESILAIAQYLKQGSVGGILYFFGERNFNASTPGIANASLNGELVLRPYGTLPHPNVLAGYLLIVMVLVLFAWLFQKPKKVLSIKYLVLSIAPPFSLIMGTIALVLTMSRVANVLWVLILIGVFIQKHIYSSSERSGGDLPAGRQGSNNLAIQQFSNFFSSRLAQALLVVSIAVLALFILFPLGSRFTNISIADEAVFQRRVLIERSLEMLQTHPLLGVGLGNFIPTLATIQKPLSLGLYLQPVHNIFLLVAAETGLIGLGFFVWFLWKTFRMANGKWQMANGLSVCFLTILTLGLFDHYWLTLQQGQLLFALIIGLIYAPNPDKNFS